MNRFHGQPLCRKEKKISVSAIKNPGWNLVCRVYEMKPSWRSTAWAVCTVNTKGDRGRKVDSSCSSSFLCTVRQAENGAFVPKSWCILAWTDSSEPKTVECVVLIMLNFPLWSFLWVSPLSLSFLRNLPFTLKTLPLFLYRFRDGTAIVPDYSLRSSISCRAHT